MTSTTTKKLRKSMKLTPEQIDYLEKKTANKSKVDVAIELGVNKDVVDRVKALGVCHEKTYIKLFPDQASS